MTQQKIRKNNSKPSLIKAIFCYILASIYSEELRAQEDKRVLTLDQTLAWVARYHPVMRQADLTVEAARFLLRQSRGDFDPQLKGFWNEKQYQSTLYYQYIDTYLSVPLWIGDIKAGYEYNQGQYISADRRVPEEGLFYAGIRVPIGYGLFMDERRNAIRQAQLMGEMARAERMKMINKLYFDVVKDYWSWYFAYQQKQVLEQAYEVVRIRYEATVEKVRMGEQAVIDSLEVAINLQDRLLLLQEAEAELIQARLKLSAHLWSPDRLPLEIQADVVPENPTQDFTFSSLYTIEQLQQQLEAQHPELQKLRLKFQALDFDRRLQIEKLKPKLDISYNFMSVPSAAAENMEITYLRNNYKFGIEFGFPLFLRTSRGKLQEIRIKQQQVTQEEVDLSRNLLNKLEATYRELLLTEQMLMAQIELVESYRALRDGEYAKFIAGESYVFLVNKREEKLLDAELKLAKTQANYEKLKAEVLWISGLPLWELSSIDTSAVD